MTEVIDRAPATAALGTPSASTAQQPALAQVEREVETVRARNGDCVVSKFNPRTKIDRLYIAFLAGSIQRLGIMQRPQARRIEQDGVTKYELIFGQCRWLANTMNYGDDGFIDLDVVKMTDEEAMLAAQSENTVRAPMSAVEEAEGAAKLLATFNGDRDMVAKELGWARSKVDTMLKLMACSERVRQQLAESTAPLGKMPIGVAELLAGLPYEKQDHCLDDFVRRGGFPTIDALKAEIQQLSSQLNAAIFDKAECLQCPNNSAQQRAMFDTGLDEGYCLNSSCYERKTEGELQRRCDELKDTYATIKIVRPGDNYGVVKLMAEGEAGVGAEQAEACRSCSDFGAAVSAVPAKLGKVVGSLCFNATCHSEKNRSYRASQAPAQPAQQQSATASNEAAAPAAAPPTSKGPSGTAEGAQASSQKAKKPEKAGAAEPTVTLTNGVLDFRDQLYRTVIAKEIGSAPERGFAMLLALAASHRLSAVPSDVITGVLRKHANGASVASLGKNFESAMTLPLEKLSSFVFKMGAVCADHLTRDEQVEMVKQLKPDWNLHFTLTADFLRVLTKTEIKAVARDVGLHKAIGATFDGLFAKKKDEIIDALTKVDGFNYVGALPGVLKPTFSRR